MHPFTGMHSFTRTIVKSPPFLLVKTEVGWRAPLLQQAKARTQSHFTMT